MSYGKLLGDVSEASQAIRTSVSLLTYKPEKRKFNNFANIIKNLGVAKAYRFEIEFTTPKFMTEGKTTQETLNTVLLLAESAQIPEFVLATNQIHDEGQSREIVYDKIYPPVVLTFICDGDMIIKKFFDTWAQGIMKNRHGTYRYKDQYTIDKLTIKQLNDAGEEVYRADLYEAYPKLVNDVVMSASAKDFNRCQVQFAYKYWESTLTPQPRPKEDKLKKAIETIGSGANSASILTGSAKKFL